MFNVKDYDNQDDTGLARLSALADFTLIAF